MSETSINACWDMTEDCLFGGKLRILQPRKGYRFAIDAVLLAGLCNAKKNDLIVDLGTGCGVIPLILAHRQLGKKITGLEIQPTLARIAWENVRINKMEEKIRIITGDIKKVAEYLPSEETNLVVSNPPYRKVKTGRVNPNEEKARARHELLGSLEDVLVAAKYLLKTGGRLVVVYPAFRLAHLSERMVSHGYAPKKLTVIFSAPGENAQLVVMEGRKGGGEELHVVPPFFIYGTGGEYSPEMERLYEE